MASITLDDFVRVEGTRKIDFIKMDIEGAELSALQGAKETLRIFRPDLAIAVYHSLPDFWRIPQYLDELGLGYRFYLRHFTIHRRRPSCSRQPRKVPVRSDRPEAAVKRMSARRRQPVRDSHENGSEYRR